MPSCKETCPTHAERTLKYLEAKETNLPAGSPPFQKMQKSKENRYKALISVVQHLVEVRKLNFRPTFLFPVVSALGFMNKDMNELFKVLVTNFGDNLKKQPSRWTFTGPFQTGIEKFCVFCVAQR